MMKLSLYLDRKKNYMKVRKVFDDRNLELTYHGGFLLTRDNIWDSIFLTENKIYEK